MKVHKWNNMGSKQWGRAGLPRTEAETRYQCDYCGQNVAVKYHSGEGIGEALKRMEISEECPKGVENSKPGGKKIYCFINGGSPNWWNVIAICEDGHHLASHTSSTEGWAKHDIGLRSEWKHDKYKEHCPDGYELIWVERDEVVRQIKEKEGPLHIAFLENDKLRAESEKKDG